jgi:ribulose-phosphate 3-epimerase
MSLPLKIAPSILAADFSRLGEEIAAAEAAGADLIHIDVMDGHFVPNLSIGPAIVKSIRPVTRLPLDVHLMVTEPDRYLEPFAKAGADSLVVHVEACQDLPGTLRRIKDMALRAGVSIKPETPTSALESAITDLDYVLVMTVNPGFGGQTFMEESLPRIAQVRAMLDRHNPVADLSVDGGIGPETGPRAVAAGANVLIMGTAIFRSEKGIGGAITDIRQRAMQAQ